MYYKSRHTLQFDINEYIVFTIPEFSFSGYMSIGASSKYNLIETPKRSHEMYRWK